MSKKIFGILIVLMINCTYYLPYHDYYIKKQSEFPQKVNFIAIAPVNSLTGFPDFLINKKDVIDSLLVEYLTTNNYKVVSTKISEQIWSRVKKNMGGLYNPETGDLDTTKLNHLLSLYTKELSDSFMVDLIIFPSIVKRTAELVEQSLLWDGVRRDMIVVGSYTTLNSYTFSGKTGGISIQSLIINTNGKIIFESFGGIEPILKVDYSVDYHGLLKERGDLLENNEYLKDGIRISLHPIIKCTGIPIKSGSMGYKIP